MSIQKLSVRLVLAMLALDAVCCVVGILSGERAAVPAAIGCSLAAAVGAGIILLMGRLGARENWRAFALTVMGFVLGELLLMFLIACSELLGAAGRGWQLQEAITELAAFCLLLALPVLLSVRLWKLPNFRVTSRIIVTWQCIVFLVAVFAVGAENRAAADVLWPIAFMLLVMSTMVGLAFGRGGISGMPLILFRVVTIIAALTGVFLFATSLEMRGSGVREWFWIPTAIAFGLGYFNAMCLCPLASNERWVRWMAVLCTAAALTMICLANWNPVVDYQNPEALARQEALGRWAGGLSVIAGLVTLGVFILSLRGMLQKPVQVRTASYTTLAISCPNCQTLQTLPTPSARCGQCEMQFELRVIEPRCAGCDYLLLMYKGEQCPECGMPISRPPGPVAERGESVSGAAEPEPPVIPSGVAVAAT